MSEWKSAEIVREYVAKTIDPVVGWYEYEVNFPDLERLIPKDAKSVLDFGCGAGEFTEKFSEVFEIVVGTDIEPMLSAARMNHPDLNLVEWNGESEIPNELGKYDVIFSKLVLQFIDNLEQVASNFRSILNDAGTVVVSVPNPKKISEKFNLDPDKVTRYDDEVGNTGIKIRPIYRPKEYYLEIFTNVGFEILEISEPLVSEDVLKKYNVSPEYNKVPGRLNLKLKKK